MWQIIRYEPSLQRRWDEFVRNSRNGTFLFERAYMDYHSDRFADHSLLALRNGKLRAMLPANISSDGVLHSHQGLTYGGWILPPAHIDGADLLELWQTWLDSCRAEGIRAVDYKPLPWIFAAQPSQEDIYCLFRCGARLESSQLSSAIALRNNPGFNMSKRQQLKAGKASYAFVHESDDIEGFMAMLTDCLRERHDAVPVHTAAEMRLLKDAFPKNIRLFSGELNGRMCAGTIIYDTGRVAHSQYIASTAEGRQAYLLTLIHNHLINEVFADRDFFDFGTSNEDAGRYLNADLLRQKASLGGTGVAFERYTIDL